MDSKPGSTPEAAARPKSDPGTVADARLGRLIGWYWAFTDGQRALLALVAVATAVMLVCQLTIPFVVEEILHEELHSMTPLVVLGGLIVIQLAFGYLSELGSHYVATNTATSMRLTVFERILRGSDLRQSALTRTSVVSRSTQDIDNVAYAAEMTVAKGIPGALRMIFSLVLLSTLSWPAALVLLLAVIVFLIVRVGLGRRLFALDKIELEATTDVGETVDETVSGARSISALALEPWMQQRMTRRARFLEHAGHRMGVKVAQLATAAHGAGLVGLFAVILFGGILGGESLAAVAASLLFVEGVVRGLEALPPWVRSLQLALASKRRIQDILNSADPAEASDVQAKSARADLNLAAAAGEGTRQLVGLVTPASVDTDSVLVALSADGDTLKLRRTVDGLVVRSPGASSEVLHVTDDIVAFDASLLEHLQAGDADISREGAVAILQTVGLGHLVDAPIFEDEAIGLAGAHLTVNERQRLMLAVALCAPSPTLLVGPILSLSDEDSALPLIETLRQSAKDLIVIAIRSPEAAAEMDRMLFVTDESVATGTHAALLQSDLEYGEIWNRRMQRSDVDLSTLGLAEDVEASLYTRLVTESVKAGEILYRAGDPADRIIFVISGHVSLEAPGADGELHRVAVLGPGNHCGDLRLTVAETRAETAVAVDDVVVRSLSREAVSAGVTGLLDRPPLERRIVASLLRSGPTDLGGLAERFASVTTSVLSASVANLLKDGAIRDNDGRFSVVLRRATKAGAADLLDKIAGPRS